MELKHLNVTPYFTITGLSDVPGLQFSVSLLILFVYLVTMGGNMVILLLVHQDRQLHTPMYLFLSNLSILDICSSINSAHNILISFVLEDHTISVYGYLFQIFIFICLTCVELLLLSAMSYDRYVAICKPLGYNMIMNSQVCTSLAISCWVLGALESVPIVFGWLKVTCYRSNTINHFCCDILLAMKLINRETSLMGVYILTLCVFISAFCPFLLTVTSYVFIFASVLKITSTTGRQKAFYTCFSELTVFILLYTTLAIQFFRPLSLFSLDSNKLISLFNTVAVPILNPLIYCLKNENVKAAFRRSLKIIALNCSKP